MNIYTHECMGDHLICQGGIRDFANKSSEKIYVRTFKPGTQHFLNIQRLYSSMENVEVIPSEEAEKWDSYILFGSTQEWFDKVKYWYDYSIKDKRPFDLGEDMIFDRYWYNLIGLPLSLKWDNFWFERIMEKEKEIFYDIMKLKDGEEFIFLHEDPHNKDEDRTIKRKYIDSNVCLINMEDYPDVSILDTGYLIQKAKEVHVINSSFRTFIDLMNINHNKLFYHKYTRANPVEQPAVRLNWNVIEE